VVGRAIDMLRISSWSVPDFAAAAAAVAGVDVCRQRWGWRPMSGWLHEFERRGLIEFEHRTQTWQAAA
jgi:hypothetical protein